MEDDFTTPFRRRLGDLKQEADSWRAHWAEIQKYICPRRGKYLTKDPVQEDSEGDKINDYLFTGLPMRSALVLAAGLQGGLTMPARPWFHFAPMGEEKYIDQELKRDLETTQKTMLTALAVSNFYGATHSMYLDLSLFGTGAILVEADDRSFFRFHALTAGEYYCSAAPSGFVDTLYRRTTMTVYQLVTKFGKENVSDGVRRSWEDKQYEKRYVVIHAIEPRGVRDLDSRLAVNMPYLSVYFEEAGEAGKVLRVSGYKSIPFAVCRWTTTGSDVYGRSPGMDVLPDAKQLHKMIEKKLKALDKMVDPPMNADPFLKAQGGASIIPGAVNYVPMNRGGAGFTPAMQLQLNTQELGLEINRVEEAIREGFFNHIFMASLGETKRMTATEIMQRSAEQMRQLGPITLQIQGDFLDPVIYRCLGILYDQGVLEPIPSLAGSGPISVEYLGPLAKAQAMGEIYGLQQFYTFVATAASAQASSGEPPTALDKVNVDTMIDQMAAILDVSHSVIRTKREVDAIRSRRAAEAAQAQQLQMGEQGSVIAKNAAESVAKGGKMFEDLANRAIYRTAGAE